VKILRAILLALVLSLLFGLAVGTVIRMQLERPQRYMVWQPEPVSGPLVPDRLLDSGAPILDARHHEEKIG